MESICVATLKLDVDSFSVQDSSKGLLYGFTLGMFGDYEGFLQLRFVTGIMNLSSDRSWMGRRKSSTEIGATAEFRAGCQVFLEYAYSHPKCVNDKNQIRCPCHKCKNNNYLDRDIVNYHLLVTGFMKNYEECWWAHGQTRDGGFTVNNPGSSSNYHMNEMVHNMAGPDFDWEQAREQPMNSDAKDFFKLLDEGSEPLWDGCIKHSKLSAVATILNIKADHNMSHECFESLLKAIKNYFPDEVLTKANRVSRNDDGGNVELNGRLVVFGLSGRAYGKEKRIFMPEKELHAAHTYILLNCEEIDTTPYMTYCNSKVHCVA
ncbi:hypothetical protein POM88_009009 [Heracleum sosnowskyi]|uniref:Transposase-associated domain-containing protein n=1 Tax=Heracleum sosnowskyi TaxID=360622 RepID=A0AAD8JAM0_9APIA|nr:hypothetical protein POM88_009009 [Heracleum sosnowskyi]